jgi:rod shape-determining protein MreD
MAVTNKTVALFFLAAVPAMFLFFAVMLTLIPKHADGLSQFMPLLYMPVVFFWAVHYPGYMPHWLVFVAGLLVDAISGQPLGISSLLMMGMLVAVHFQYKTMHKEGFVLKWAVFTMLLGGITLVQWIMMSVYHQQFLNPQNGLLQWFMTVALYPALHQLFDAAHQAVQNRRVQLLHSR